MKLVLAALCAVAVLPAAAQANPLAAEQVKIRTSDLDLSKPADQNRLEIRLSEAAADVCGRGADRIHNIVKDQARECQAGVIADYRGKLDQRIAAATTGHQLAMR